jgi:hypothetical protein
MCGSGLVFVKLVDNFSAMFSFVTNEGPVFYFRTNLAADRRKVIAIDTTRPAQVCREGEREKERLDRIGCYRGLQADARSVAG